MELKNILKLAGLDLTEKEKLLYQKQIGEVIDFNMSKLKGLEVKDVEPTFQTTSTAANLGEDEPRPSLSTEEVLANARDKEKNLFKVKAIFDPAKRERKQS